MNDIYWITRFDAINTMFTIAMTIGIIAIIIFSIVYYSTNGQSIYEESRDHKSYAKEYREYANTCLKGLKVSIPLTTLAIILFILTPTTEQALLIYGVGGTIDYLKSNPTAKQLPDKCIKALNVWVDSWTSEKNDSIKKKE